MNPRIRVVDLVKRFGAVTAVDHASFDVGEGELISLLGPSGCGKTTTLRCIGGYETPTEGSIELAGRTINDVPIHKREIGMVFQNYALFPHKTVADNVGFALKMRGVSKDRRRDEVAEALALVDMEGSRTATRRSSPAASPSASRLPGPSSTGPPSCCSTSRSRTWTGSCARRCAWSSSSSRRRSASARSW